MGDIECNGPLRSQWGWQHMLLGVRRFFPEPFAALRKTPPRIRTLELYKEYLEGGD